MSSKSIENVDAWGWIGSQECQLIEYADSAFASATGTARCEQRFAPQDLSEAAVEDWQSINEAVIAAAIPVREVSFVMYSGDRIAQAEFSLNVLSVERWTYVFDSGQAPARDDSGPDVTIVPIDQEWHLRVEDWN